MHHLDNRWALILAAGDGRRLHGLTTTTAGFAIPKQFCSLNGGPSLLQEALHRAAAVAPPERICTIVAEQHQRWWGGHLDSLPASNIIVQPRNRGTANGVLLPLLYIVERDPSARVVLLPSDHHVQNEACLAYSLRAAAAPPESESASAEILLLGIEPREADPELGYIVPGRANESGHKEVESFVEKPPAARARELIDQGGLWNSFIVAADAPAFLKLFQRRCPEIVTEMRNAVRRSVARRQNVTALAELYDNLPELDFSREILQGQEQYLRVLPVPECGWSDLGTPQRVADVLRELPTKGQSAAPMNSRAFLSLAAQHNRLRAPGSGPVHSVAN